MIIDKNIKLLKKEMDAAATSGIRFFRLLEKSGNQILAKNTVTGLEAKMKGIIAFLSGNPDHMQGSYIIEGYTVVGSKLPQLTIEYRVKDAEAPEAPTTTPKVYSNAGSAYEMNTASIEELASLRVQNKHLEATIRAQEAKIEELLEYIEELEETEETEKPDQVSKILEQITNHTPAIMEVIKIFRPAPPIPNLRDAPVAQAPEPQQMQRYTPEYWQWIESIIETNQPIFMQEYTRAKAPHLNPNIAETFEQIASRYQNEP